MVGDILPFFSAREFLFFAGEWRFVRFLNTIDVTGSGLFGFALIWKYAAILYLFDEASRTISGLYNV